MFIPGVLLKQLQSQAFKDLLSDAVRQQVYNAIENDLDIVEAAAILSRYGTALMANMGTYTKGECIMEIAQGWRFKYPYNLGNRQHHEH
jgi:hypothetical protein